MAAVRQHGLLIGGTGIAMYIVETEATIISPDQRHSMIVSKLDSGRDLVSKYVSFMPRGGTFSPDKNPSSFGVQSNVDLEVKWITDTEVEVTVPDSNVFQLEPRGLDGIKFTYHENSG